MNAINRISILALFSALALAMALATPAPAQVDPPEQLFLDTEKSIVLSLDEDITRVSLASPEVAEVLVLSPRQVYITGKATGATTLTIWGKGDRIQSLYEVVVSPDLTNLKQMLHTVLPEESGIRVISSGGKITLSGQVSSSTNLATAVDLAEAVAASPEQVVNLMSVGGVHQVMLEVRVAEMSRSVTKQLGFNFAFSEGGNIFYTFLNEMSFLSEEGDLLFHAEAVNALFSGSVAGFNLIAFLDALKTQGLVKVLAEPTLVCLSGETANFLVGGEIPVPIPQGLGTVAIQYKPFGVWLEFTPTVLSNEKISMVVNPEVSELDFDNGITIDSITVPALTTSRASTTIELGDGQSFAIAGLLQNNVRENTYKYPVLGDLPIIGALFRSSDYLKEQTELVIIITPHLAKPTDMAKQTLPTDSFREPNDLEFYLLGLLESPGSGQRPEAPGTTPVQGPESGFDGQFGYTLPN